MNEDFERKEGEDELRNRLHILLVDDNDMVLKSVRKLLSDRGHLVTSCDSPFSAIEFMRKVAGQTPSDERPDILITDFSMNGMTGEMCIKRIRELCPDIPAIVMSGDIDQLEFSDGDPMVLTIEKPFNAKELTDVINSVRELVAKRLSERTPEED